MQNRKKQKLFSYFVGGKYDLIFPDDLFPEHVGLKAGRLELA